MCPETACGPAALFFSALPRGINRFSASLLPAGIFSYGIALFRHCQTPFLSGRSLDIHFDCTISKQPFALQISEGMHLTGEPAQQAALSILPETDAKKQQVWKDSLLLPAELTGVLPGTEPTAFYGTGAPGFLRQRKPDLTLLAYSSAKYKLSAACADHSDRWRARLALSITAVYPVRALTLLLPPQHSPPPW